MKSHDKHLYTGFYVNINIYFYWVKTVFRFLGNSLIVCDFGRDCVD